MTSQGNSPKKVGKNFGKSCHEKSNNSIKFWAMHLKIFLQALKMHGKTKQEADF